MLGKRMLVAGLVLIAGACSPPLPTPSAVPPTAAITERPVDPVIAETIHIQQPGPGSQLISPLHVIGEADSAFGQTLHVRLLDVEGDVIAEGTAQIAAPAGERGRFDAGLPFSIGAPQSALLQVYSSSARDGGILHLASVGVMLKSEGTPVISPAGDAVEQLVITEPSMGTEIPSGLVLVSGYGTPSFEGTLLLSLLDREGDLLAEEILIVVAEELGQSGPFESELSFSVTERQSGRIVLIDPLPVFNGVGHIVSLPVILLP